MKKGSIFFLAYAFYFASESRTTSGEERFLEQLKIVLSEPARFFPKKERNNKALHVKFKETVSTVLAVGRLKNPEKTDKLLQSEASSSNEENNLQSIRTEFSEAGATVNSWAAQYASKNREKNYSRFEHYVKYLRLIPEDVDDKLIRLGQDTLANKLCEIAIKKYLEERGDDGPAVRRESRKLVVASRNFYPTPQSPWYRCRLYFKYHRNKDEFLSLYFGKVESPGISGYLIRLNGSADLEPENFVDFVTLKYANEVTNICLNFPELEIGKSGIKAGKKAMVKIEG